MPKEALSYLRLRKDDNREPKKEQAKCYDNGLCHNVHFRDEPSRMSGDAPGSSTMGGAA